VTTRESVLSGAAAAGTVLATRDAAGTRGLATINQAGEARSARIESLRAVAALGVLMGHVLGQGVGYGPAATATYWRSTVFGGGLGVFVFFALSGYLLYRPFARRDLFGGASIDTARYLRNRALRILPLYYICIGTWMIVDGRVGNGGDVLRFATFSETWFPSTVAQVDGPAWSLCCEAQFYVLLPLVAAGVALVSRRDPRVAALLLSGALLALFLVRAATVIQSQASASWRYSLPANAVFFLPGMLLAACEPLVIGRIRSLPAVLRLSTTWLAASGALWLLVFADYRREEVMIAATLLLLAGCVLPLRPGIFTTFLEWRPLAMVGVASYSLYLWHLPIVSRFPAGSSTGDFVGTALVAVPTCLAVAGASYVLIERPWLRLRRRWTADPRHAQVTG
jgi:peptidoglycan/LPS O-acetylase OafA/YrhL